MDNKHHSDTSAEPVGAYTTEVKTPKHVGVQQLLKKFEDEGIFANGSTMTREKMEDILKTTLEAAQGQPGVAQALREGAVTHVEYTSKEGGFQRGTISITFSDPETMQRAVDELEWVRRQDSMFAVCVGKLVHDPMGVTASLNEYSMVTNQNQKLFTSKPEAVFANYADLESPDLYLRYEGDGQFGRWLEADQKTGSGYFSSSRVREMLGRRGVNLQKKEGEF
ncbi:hypothetical protein D3C71_77290 [compost metagenome]